MNCLTEMYSAIQAEVPIPSDTTTTRNTELLNALADSKRVSLRRIYIHNVDFCCVLLSFLHLCVKNKCSHMLKKNHTHLLSIFSSFCAADCVRPGLVPLCELHRAAHRSALAGNQKAAEEHVHLGGRCVYSLFSRQSPLVT